MSMARVAGFERAMDIPIGGNQPNHGLVGKFDNGSALRQFPGGGLGAANLGYA